MKKYKFTDEANTWWAEYWVDGMKTQDNQTILSIRSQDTNGVINHTDLFDFMTALGLPNKVGTRFTHAEWVTMAETLTLRMLMNYEVEDVVAYRTSTAKDFLSFSFPEQGQVGESVIDTENATIDVNVTAATDTSALTPTWIASFGTFVTEGLSTDIESGEDELDFTDPVTLAVHSETPLDYKEYEVTVTNLSDAVLITAFVMDEQTGAATIDDEAGTIAITVVALTDPSELIPTITLSTGATVSPASLVEQDFTDPVVYTVTSQDLTATKEYTVTVTVAT